MLIQAKCRHGGQLTINDHIIQLSRPGFLHGDRRQTMYRSALVGIDDDQAVASLFGLGGAITLTFRGKGGDAITAEWIKPAIAREIKSALGF